MAVIYGDNATVRSVRKDPVFFRKKFLVPPARSYTYLKNEIVAFKKNYQYK